MRIRRLLEGHREYTDSYVRAEGSYLKQLATEGQQPDTLLVSCSDSRVIPELITGVGPGHLFVVRNVGNIVPPFESANGSVGAALEYAIEHLRVAHLVVLGHYGCGGMAALPKLCRAPGAVPAGGPLAWWLEYARASYDEAAHAGAFEKDDWLDVLVEENVLQQLAHAITYPAVYGAAREGRLHLHAWTYGLQAGDLRFFDSTERAFLPARGPSADAAGLISIEEIRAQDNV